jgi:hypothetical protein
MEGKDITSQFSLDEIDHHEFLDVLTSRYTTSWRVGKDAITFPASADYKIELRISHGEVERVFAGKALTDVEPSCWRKWRLISKTTGSRSMASIYCSLISR